VVVTDNGIEWRDVRVEAGGRTLLALPSLGLTERRVGLVGANGAGKSTLLRSIVGLVNPTAGTIHVDGVSVSADPAAIRRRVGLLVQNPDAQIVMPTVREDLGLGLRARRLARAEADHRIAAVLDRLGIADLSERAVHTLSGGEKQLVALAGVLVLDPARLLFDEPTTMLDRPNRRRILEAIAGLDLPVLVATHDLALLDAFDRVLVLDGGRIVADNRPGPAIAAYVERYP
jgi:biotin transport system ATP-binding protein